MCKVDEHQRWKTPVMMLDSPHTSAPMHMDGSSPVRESVLFIGTQLSNLYTAVDTPAKGRVGVCVVFVCLVFACKYVLGHSRVSQPSNSGYASSGTLAFSLRRMPPRRATDDALTHTGSSAALRPAPLPSHGPIPFNFPPRPDLHHIHLQ
jgi:hypothetical protein